MRKSIEYSVLLLFLIPLFFVNIKSSHDWGDDFAQYIHQAKNIAEKVSQNNTGYVFNGDVFLGPQAYPTGFPILLSPLIKHYGFDFKVLNYYMTFFLVIVCLFGFLILRERFSYITAFFTTLIIAYNPFILNFKTEIVSDLAFTSFLLASIYLISGNKSFLKAIALGILIAFLSHIRAIGLLVIIVFATHELFFGNQIKNASFNLHQKLIITLFCFFVFYLGLKFAFPCNTNYPSFFEFNGLFERANEHISYHFLSLSYFFNIYEPKSQYFIGVIASSCIIVFCILGFLYDWKKHKFNFINLFVISYVTTIAIFKFGDQGLRFLIPILFFIFYYSIIALKYVLQPLVGNWMLNSIVFGLIILLSYKPVIEKLLETENQILDGPCTDASFEMFNYIKSLNLTGEIIVFEKPRALALFTNCASVALSNNLNTTDVNSQINKYHAKYVLLHKQLYNQSLSSLTNSNSSNCELIFSNIDYQFYRLK